MKTIITAGIVLALTLGIAGPAYATTIDPANCPDGTVGGWLDENGDPQGCVNNEAFPGDTAPVIECVGGVNSEGEVFDTVCITETPAPTETTTVAPAPTELAETGTNETVTWTAGILSAVFVLFGTALVTGRRKES